MISAFKGISDYFLPGISKQLGIENHLEAIYIYIYIYNIRNIYTISIHNTKTKENSHLNLLENLLFSHAI